MAQRASQHQAIRGACVRRWLCVLAVSGITLAAVGCGPVMYLSDVSDAEKAVSAARAGNANYYAPYELAFAEAHLAKAHEEAARGQYEDAVQLASVAETYGKRALEISAEKGGLE